MTIEVTEISKISLAENEILMFTLPNTLTQNECQQVICGIQAAIPAEWHGRILIISDVVQITKISK